MAKVLHAMHGAWRFPKGVLKEALRGVPRGFKGRIVYAELVKRIDKQHEANLQDDVAPVTKGKRKQTATMATQQQQQQQGVMVMGVRSGVTGGGGVSSAQVL